MDKITLRWQEDDSHKDIHEDLGVDPKRLEIIAAAVSAEMKEQHKTQHIDVDALIKVAEKECETPEEFTCTILSIGAWLQQNHQTFHP